MEKRYYLYKKYRSETCNLPPSPGAFLQHVKRACVPLRIWSSANLANTTVPIATDFGWEDCEEVMMPICTDEDDEAEDGAEVAKNMPAMKNK